MEAVNADKVKLAARNGAQSYIDRANAVIRRVEAAYTRDVSISEADMDARRDSISDALRRLEDPMASTTVIEGALAELIQRTSNVEEWLAVKASAKSKSTTETKVTDDA